MCICTQILLWLFTQILHFYLFVTFLSLLRALCVSPSRFLQLQSVSTYASVIKIKRTAVQFLSLCHCSFLHSICCRNLLWKTVNLRMLSPHKVSSDIRSHSFLTTKSIVQRDSLLFIFSAFLRPDLCVFRLFSHLLSESGKNDLHKCLFKCQFSCQTFALPTTLKQSGGKMSTHTHVPIDTLCSVQSAFSLWYNANHTRFHFKTVRRGFFFQQLMWMKCVSISFFFPIFVKLGYEHMHTSFHFSSQLSIDIPNKTFERNEKKREIEKKRLLE